MSAAAAGLGCQGILQNSDDSGWPECVVMSVSESLSVSTPRPHARSSPDPIPNTIPTLVLPDSSFDSDFEGDRKDEPDSRSERVFRCVFKTSIAVESACASVFIYIGAHSEPASDSGRRPRSSSVFECFSNSESVFKLVINLTFEFHSTGGS